MASVPSSVAVPLTAKRPNWPLAGEPAIPAASVPLPVCV
jgi:hypothetical protein